LDIEDVLKIDAEGFELEVLKGASSMLAQHAIKFIYFEFHEISPRKDVSGGALAPIDQLIRLSDIASLRLITTILSRMGNYSWFLMRFTLCRQ
jgi:Methyltransferase FkbM domain